MRGSLRNLIATFAAALCCLTALAPSATAQDPGPPYTDWNPRQIGFPSNAEPNRRADCAGASRRCIDRTLGEMWRRFHTVVPSCDDNNVFSLTYIRVTEDIRAGLDEGFYEDEAWINRLDALFARPYFLAYDNFRAGRTALVPPAWRVAFGSSRASEVEGIGNLLLAMNAHVNRDFPFALYHAGLVDGQGRSRKAEHDSGNERLRALYKPMLRELARRFDETIDDYDLPGVVVDDEAFFSLLVEWRESAWQNAQRLVDAGSNAERRQVAQSIEEYAVAQAESIYAGSAYLPGESTAARDARCAANGGQRRAYERGADVARFRAQTASLRGGHLLAFPIRCADGIGPCHGSAAVRGKPGRERFALEPGQRTTLRMPVGGRVERGDRLRVRLRSLLGPGVAVVRQRSLRVG